MRSDTYRSGMCRYIQYTYNNNNNHNNNNYNNNIMNTDSRIRYSTHDGDNETVTSQYAFVDSSCFLFFLVFFLLFRILSGVC